MHRPDYRIAVLASGGGTNLQALIDAVESKRIPARIALVISNNSASGALERARRHNIDCFHVSRLRFGDERGVTAELLRLFDLYDIDLIVLAGYMKLLSPDIIRRYQGRIINIHPALLPKYGGKGMFGMNVHKAVLEARDSVSGATVHVVDELYDHGRILMQETVPVLPDDTPETLAQRVLEVEHRILPEVVKRFAEGAYSDPQTTSPDHG